MNVVAGELLIAASQVRIEAAIDKSTAVSIVAYTGGQMVVPGWGPLVIDLAGDDVSASQIGILAGGKAIILGSDETSACEILRPGPTWPPPASLAPGLCEWSSVGLYPSGVA